MKNLWKRNFRASRRVSFSYFFKAARNHARSPVIPFRIFLDQVTIFSTSSMWHPRWRKIRYQLETFVTECFVLNVTGFLDLIKTTKYSIRHLHVQTQQENTRTKSSVFKVNNKDTRMTSVASIVNFEHILHFILVLLVLTWHK